jgi:hypothetical protein
MMGKPIPWAPEARWGAGAGGADQPGRIWCGTAPGGLFRSDDRGESWELVRSLWDKPERIEWFGGGYEWPAIHSICVHPRESRRVAVGISCGGVWETRDDGATWTCRATGMRAEYMPPERQADPNIQDPAPARAVRRRAGRDVGAASQRDFSDDQRPAKSWTEIEKAGPSTFGFAVAVHPKQPDTAWFVPAIKDEHRIPADGRIVVTRTRDGGKTFDVLSNGLPQRHAYDLVFRHAMDVDETGERLIFGSTTGSVWGVGRRRRELADRVGESAAGACGEVCLISP